MSRRRDLSTDISTDGKVNELSNLAALLYTWSIPHANEDASLTPKTAKEMKMLIIPGRDCTVAEVQAAMDEIFKQELWLNDDGDGVIYFPPATFYKYQNKIAADRRRSAAQRPPDTSKEPPNPTKPHQTPQIAEEQHAGPQNPVSSSFSSSSSLSFSDPALRAGSCVRARETLVDDIGLGDKHPSLIAGVDAWEDWLAHLKSRGKVASIIQTEKWGKRLLELKARGNDPVKVIDRTIRAGLIDFIELPEKERSAAVVEFIDALDMKRRARERAEVA